MAKILMQRWGDSLRPVSKAAKEAFAKIPERETVSVDVHSKRSMAQSDLYWSVLTKAAAAMNAANFKGEHWNKDKLHLALKLALGKYDLMSLNGKAVPVPQSMADWSQKVQGAYFDEAMDLLCANLLPSVGDDETTREIVGMLAQKEAA
jgi:hypothetical protein